MVSFFETLSLSYLSNFWKLLWAILIHTRIIEKNFWYWCSTALNWNTSVCTRQDWWSQEGLHCRNYFSLTFLIIDTIGQIVLWVNTTQGTAQAVANANLWYNNLFVRFARQQVPRMDATLGSRAGVYMKGAVNTVKMITERRMLATFWSIGLSNTLTCSHSPSSCSESSRPTKHRWRGRSMKLSRFPWMESQC